MNIDLKNISILHELLLLTVTGGYLDKSGIIYVELSSITLRILKNS